MRATEESNPTKSKNRLQISTHAWVTASYNKNSNDDRGATAIVEMTILASANRLV